MNDADVSKQIQQMVRFIRQEAEEKANEISVAAEEEFNIEKLQLVEAEKKKIRQEYERKEKQVEIRKKMYVSSITLSFVFGIVPDTTQLIERSKVDMACDLAVYAFHEYSMQLNASRLKVLQAQDDLVISMKEAAAKELLLVNKIQDSYEKLLQDLIVQVKIINELFMTYRYYLMGYANAAIFHWSFNLLLSLIFLGKQCDSILQSLLRLKEPAVLLRCREEDLQLVESILSSAIEEYAGKASVHPPEIVVDRNTFLPSAPTHYDAHGPY
ncbi:hypothetical protein ZIOFF_043363 [Zingiber officinale]|uniref:Uncharacterized protein n=1 Tax=Zingiber officinale TaxID=94328 RepID=A0A8J5KW92_ZINOF|nr:hypothetical protein ZIOFF_043363 [Zingiber officinale]